MYLPLGFDKSIALEAADLVNQAYQQFENFQAGTPWSLQGNYELLGEFHARPEGLFPREEPFGFVARNKTSAAVFVTFRGTQTPEDWLSDFTLPQVAHPWGQTEKGFTHLYDQCSADVQALVRGAGAAPVVFVTGHSLGAGLAVLAAADLVRSQVAPKAAMYSFAGPRAGNPAFAGNFNKNVAIAWRIVNTEDIVTTLPIPTPTLDNKPHAVSKFGTALSLLPSLDYEHVGIAVSFTTHKGSIADNHLMPVYIEALNASESAQAAVV